MHRQYFVDQKWVNVFAYFLIYKNRFFKIVNLNKVKWVSLSHEFTV